MTLNEFKAWLEGYSASFKDGVPNAEQWQEVQDRLGKVQAISIPAIDYAPRDTLPRFPSPGTEPWRPYWIGTPSDIPPGTVTC